MTAANSVFSQKTQGDWYNYTGILSAVFTVHAITPPPFTFDVADIVNKDLVHTCSNQTLVVSTWLTSSYKIQKRIGMQVIIPN